MTFGQRLKHLRKIHGLTQSQLGKVIDMKASNISKYERDALEASHQTLIRLSRFFKVSVDYLLGLSDDPGEFMTREEILKMLPEYKQQLDRDELELIEVYKGVKDKLTVERLKRIIDALIKEDL